MALAWASLAQAQQTPVDLIAPTVAHTPGSAPLSSGKPAVFQALVTDNAGVESVTLFYRAQGSQVFQRKPMERVGSSDMYRATLSRDAVTQPGLEYYLQASDLVGNILLRGSSFSPFALSVIAGQPQTTTAATANTTTHPSPAQKEIKSSPRMSPLKWVLVAVGVGAIAALAGGGGGSSGGGSGGGPVGPTDPGGSLVVTGPIPQ